MDRSLAAEDGINGELVPPGCRAEQFMGGHAYRIAHRVWGRGGADRLAATTVRRVGVRLADNEAWDVLRSSHTGILTSLRRDGVPVSLPVWFVVDDRSVLVAGPAASHKFTRIRRDERVGFLVESGEAWKDLRAVHVIGRATLVEQPDWESVDALFEAKYAGFRTPREKMPASARARYDGARALVRVIATERFLTWDNQRLGRG